MNYTLEIEINAPIHKVVELFDDRNNIHHWQPNLIRFEAISGNPGELGAETKLIYKMGNKEVEMIEVITVNQLPTKHSGVYETSNVWNLVENSFIEVDPITTRWICKNQFKCSGFVKLIAMLMPTVFKQQSIKYMQQFKVFAEAQTFP
ncbi:SRPBCC family protein [Thalassotalea aquiviva]|uniref:SRPBCC family protein n=1 Tax=Thalassotalea aquiviva TaxID=3242415 RepID=UPI00352AF8F2